MIFAFSMFANVVKAQDASIYGLEVSIENNMMDLNFYSTYDKYKLYNIHIDIFDKDTGEPLGEKIRIEYDYDIVFQKDTFIFFPRFGDGRAFIEEIENDVYYIKIDERSVDNDARNKPLKIELYLEGVDFEPPSNTEMAIFSSLGRSNVLTFYYLMPTSLKEITNTNKSVADYYTILGTKLLQEPTSGIYIIMYDNGQTEKVMK